jgi:hypothetical protein
MPLSTDRICTFSPVFSRDREGTFGHVSLALIQAGQVVERSVGVWDRDREEGVDNLDGEHNIGMGIALMVEDGDDEVRDKEVHDKAIGKNDIAGEFLAAHWPRGPRFGEMGWIQLSNADFAGREKRNRLGDSQVEIERAAPQGYEKEHNRLSGVVALLP